MPYQPTTNFRDSNGVDLGKKLVSKDYLLTVYPTLLDSIGNSGLTTPTPALWVWGTNSSGQLGINSVVYKSTPVTTFAGGTNWKSISCGVTHTLALKTDGTLWSWGNNSYGNLGVNDIISRSTPVTTLLGGTNWKSIASANSYSIALKTDGTLWTWGQNAYGQLGINLSATSLNPGLNSRSTPVTTILGGTNWKSIAGGQSTIALKTDGTLWTWGYNAYGQLGINSNTSRSTPVTTFAGGTNWKSIAAGNVHTIAIKTDGTLWTWGENGSGTLGVNDTTTRSTPVTTLLGGTNWKSISGGNGHTIALKTDGTLWTWGINYNANLGINNRVDKSTPVTTFAGGTNWKSIAGGNSYTLALKTDGTLWTWGRNAEGQLGVNNTTSRSTPVTTILGGTNWKSIASGGYFTIAIQSVDYI